MSQFELTQDQHQLLEHANRYGKDKLLPLAEKMDNEEWWPDELFAELGSLGFLGITVPEKYGGVGMGLLESGLILQAFSRWNHAIGLSWVAHDNLCLNNIYRNGSEAIREKYLPNLCSGKWTGCLGLTEPGAGSDALGSMQTRADLDGDHYVINGAKLYITNGAVADVCLLYAKTQKGAGSKGITAFVVETELAGVQGCSKTEKNGLSRQPDYRVGVRRYGCTKRKYCRD